MASILDNSGDIIIVATLTEVGRRRATTGTGIGNQIVKFCLFDDEIDYALYNKNHASGSAYSDLEIMQTPIFQPVSKFSGLGRYGLQTRPRTNTLYMVQAKPNTLISDQAVRPYNDIYYLAVNDGVTRTAIADVIGEQYVLGAGMQQGRGILIETGIDDTTAGAGDQFTKQRLITSNGLGGGGCQIQINTKLLAQVLGPGRGSYFNNNGGNGRAQVNMPLSPASPSKSVSSAAVNAGIVNIRAVNNQMVFRENDNEAVTLNSVIASARANATKIGFQTRVLTDTDFAERGLSSVTSTELFGSGNSSFKLIDTMVYVTFANGATIDLPIRIIKKIT
jgi:hypothetical protein